MEESTGGKGGRVVVNGARPLWHSARFPDPTFPTKFLRHHHRPKTVSRIDLAGSRRDFSRLVAFSENCPGSIPPRRALCQRGAPHEEPLLYSARFASPGMLIFANLWPLWHAGQNIKNHVEGLQEGLCPPKAFGGDLSGTLPDFRIPHLQKKSRF